MAAREGALERFFGIRARGSTPGREVVAGLTTFFTMAYIIVVNPKILETAGIPFGPSVTATILTAAFGSLAMGLYARRPFAIAPYMGENAFIAFTVVKVLGYSWQTALGAIFIGGMLFTLLTLLGIRKRFAEAIPPTLKKAFIVGIGLFLTFIGLNETGMVTLGVPGAPVHVGDFHSTSVLLAIAGFLLMAGLMIRRVPAAILIGMVAVTTAAILSGEAPVPETVVSMPPSIGEIFLELDIGASITWGFFSVILTVFVMDFVDTLGTLIAVGYKGDMLDEDGNLPEIEKPMLCDSLSTVVASLLGTTTAGTFIESATGIEAGGRTGLTAVVVALLFLCALFFSGLLASVPPAAYGPALIIVGMLMIEPVASVDFSDMTEVVAVFTVIILMSFTYNIGIGMTGGFVVYPLAKILGGKWREIPRLLWPLFALSLLFFVLYPY